MMLRSSVLAGLPGVRHGFFTRQGGVSNGVWASLNVGLRSGDAPERVALNRARAAEALMVAPDRLVTVRQVHGVTTLAAGEPWGDLAAPEADAVVTAARITAAVIVSLNAASFIVVSSLRSP